MKEIKKEPLKIKLYTPSVMSGNTVRLSDEAVLKVQEIQRATGISALQLISQMILHYADDVVFEEV
jgi:hypothetical protein